MVKYFLVILLPVVVFFSSCSSPRYIYAPSPPNNPYFTTKGESKLAASYSAGFSRGNKTSGTKPINNGYDLQAAYAISNNWALTASFFKRSERDVYPTLNSNYFDSSIVNYKRHIVDVGGGYFVPLDKRKTVFFNIYGGIGFGKFLIVDKGIDKSGFDYNRFHHSNIIKWFFQPSINSIAGKYFRASFIGRISFVHYGNISTTYANEELQYFFLVKIRNKTIAYIEPTFNLQIVIPDLDGLKIDGGFTFSSDPFRDIARIEARSFNAMAGLCFDLSKLK